MKPNQLAALYLRSSKDRSDVSIDAQRRELQKLATDRGYLIVHEYVDVVESGKDVNRPGFQALLRDIKVPDRQWRALLMVDTSRLSRRRYVAQAFKHEARKRGIEIIYSKVPEVDPITNVLIESVLEAFDEVHSLMSREKGLSGMAENIAKGYRAGGRAPRGYSLKHIATGTVREGEQVTKSTLEPSAEAALVARYLKARACGRSRKALRAELGLSWKPTTLVGMEWNALTYAGHTVWNVHNEFDHSEGYKGGTKRRPRNEWLIKRDTHPPLITHEEAEALLAQLDTSPHRHGQIRRTPAAYLLTGILKAPDGDIWYGNGSGRYRTKVHRKNVSQAGLETAVVRKVLHDMNSSEFIRQLTIEAKKFAEKHREDPAEQLRPVVQDLTAQISRLMDIAAQMVDPAPAIRKIDELERKRKSVAEEISRLDQEYTAAAMMRDLTESTVSQLLSGVVEQVKVAQRETLKDILNELIEHIVLDPVSLECQIQYRIGLRNNMASPRGSATIPILRIATQLKVA